MKFTCDKNDFQNAVAITAKAAASKSMIPALEGLLIETQNDRLKITGYDLKKGIFTFIDSSVQEHGSIVLNARLLGEMIRRMPDGTVEVIADEKGKVDIFCGKSEYSFMSLEARDYPELPTIDESENLVFPQKLLKTMITQTIFAVADNDSRPIYTGTLFDIDNDQINLVSVDGYRLALRQEKLESSVSDGKTSFIVPGTALTDVERNCGEEGDVKIFVGEKHISFEIGETVIISRRLEGDFLNYRNSIPTDFKVMVKVNKQDFLRSVDRVALMIVNEQVKNPIRMKFKDSTINMSCVTPIGRAEDVCFFDGECEYLEIGFNDKYLMDAVKNAPSENIMICLNSGSSPCILKSGDDEGNYTYMILPVRLKAE